MMRMLLLSLVGLLFTGCSALGTARKIKDPVYYKFETESDTKGTISVPGAFDLDIAGVIRVEVHGAELYVNGEKVEPVAPGEVATDDAVAAAMKELEERLRALEAGEDPE